MNDPSALAAFLNPRSIAVIGASEKPGTWGCFIMDGLQSWGWPGIIYPVNPGAPAVFGIPAYRDINDIPGTIDLAVIAIPEKNIEAVIESCGRKGVRGISIITAGFGEAVDGGRERELAIARLARSYGVRLLGPNISGTFNLHGRFNAAASPGKILLPTALAGVCQGGYAFYDLLASGESRGMGVGQFIHTGNECDLTVTDFLEYFGNDDSVRGILMYLETVRDGRRFMEAARAVTKKKPVVAYKAGRTPGSARAAASHTGALAGRKDLFEGFFSQTGIMLVPHMEVLVPAGHALIERPPMRGKRIGIVTVGGSWGVALSDAMEEGGLTVPELSAGLQKKLRTFGMPQRASTKNPVDIGAAGFVFSVDDMVGIGREVLTSGEVDALILHGFGRPGMVTAETPDPIRFYAEVEKAVIRGFAALEAEVKKPVLVGSHYAPWQSQVIFDLNGEGVRIFNRLDEAAQILNVLAEYWKRRGRE